MNEFEKSQDRLRRRNVAEQSEVHGETKEKEAESAEKKLAARERMEQTSKEVKSTQQQMQNIVANMQQVIKAVAAIRAQLGLVEDSNIPSVQQDEKSLELLKTKLSTLMSEAKDLEYALGIEERKRVQEEHPEWGVGQIEAEVKRRVRQMMEKLKV